MKTAISIPDELFLAADRLARRLGVTRSGLYARALSDFLDRQRDSTITDRLNQVYAEDAGKLDPALDRAQKKALPGDENW